MMMPTELIFDPKLLGTKVQAKLPENLVIRPLSSTDFNSGFLDCLSGLTVVGDVTEEMYVKRFELMKRTLCKHVVVVYDNTCNRVVATGAVFVEPKFTRECGLLGHIEDVSVHPHYQGKKLGALMIEQLKDLCEVLDCYKISLNCNTNNIPFYEKCGFSKKEQQMVIYL
ncbi:Glucosamine 6-phosphate N-acetyltransferase [Smittium mucronatum]|uniref:Glucosamine 6-phosphate N-acetyltransferase n=1 Tax=Smittium mucronatum TaxID=133383 RepID=A0A1R0H1I3_9FUNG|nr:Glucosamine 6-phosphate N-acetyltransferase [Smittium mucronatum]